jgi:hypothetical protein
LDERNPKRMVWTYLIFSAKVTDPTAPVALSWLFLPGALARCRAIACSAAISAQNKLARPPIE